MKNKKGCVYFFRHIGLTPIKIGFSDNESPISRFNQFKTYAPFGAELIGFIITSKPQELEKQLHLKYSRDRIKGEWFEITENEANKCINFYSNLEDIEEKNNFQIEWAKKKMPVLEKANIVIENFSNFLSFDKKNGFEKEILNQTEISIILNCEKNIIKQFFNQENIKSKTYKVNGFAKNGYLLFKKVI
jgi:hypothetical protein